MNAGPSKGTIKVTVWTYLFIQEGKRGKGQVFEYFSQGHDLDFAMNVVELAPFPAFLKDIKEHDIATLESSNAIQKPPALLYCSHLCLSLECPYSRSDCTTYPLSFSR